MVNPSYYFFPAAGVTSDIRTSDTRLSSYLLAVKT